MPSHLAQGPYKYMMIKKIILLLLLLLPTTAQAFTRAENEAFIRNSVGYCGDPCIVYHNNGGSVYDFFYAGLAIRRGARSMLVINGFCGSSCVTMADWARPRSCITPYAVFALHRSSKDYSIPLQFYIRRWARQHGGLPKFGGALLYMNYNDARQFWKTCRIQY